MARIRSVKPEFWANEQVAQCSIPARVLFLGMLNFCDDGGVHPASAHRLKSQVFPSDNFTNAEIQAMVDELITVGLLSTYEAAGKRFWNVTGWHHQKIDKPTYSYPGSKELGESAVNYRKNLLEKTEKNRRDLGEESSSSRRELDEASATERSRVEQSREESKGEESKGVDPNTDSCSESAKQTSEPTSEERFSLGVDSHVWPCFVVTGAKSSEKAKWTITEQDISEWQRAYPAVDVRQECYKAHAWIKANWEKRKTFSGYGKFLLNWLSGAQNSNRGMSGSRHRFVPGPGQNYDPTAGANDPSFGRM